MTADNINEKTYTASLIIIGNEILTGRTQDANTAWLAQQLLTKGIRLMEVRIIPDTEEAIIKTVNELRQSFDYIMTTGGIGPTHDDITAECIAKAFGKKLELNDAAFKILLDYYGEEDFTDARKKMAMIPETAILIDNPVSAAPGFNLENVFVMAGVPKIMRAMFDHIIEMIEVGDPVLSNTVTCGLPESVIAPDLTSLQEEYSSIEIGSYPHYRGGVLGLSIVLRGVNENTLDEATKKVIEAVRAHGEEPKALNVRGEKIFGTD